MSASEELDIKGKTVDPCAGDQFLCQRRPEELEPALCIGNIPPQVCRHGPEQTAPDATGHGLLDHVLGSAAAARAHHAFPPSLE
jgi:hypothetical protein